MKFRNVLGVGLLAGGAVAAYKTMEKIKTLKATYDEVITFNGAQKVYESFDGASLAVVFGGLEVDLTDAVMEGESATLTLKGEFSGISVQVPRDWNVKVDGVEDKAGLSISTEFDMEDTEAKLLVIEYDVAYSGLEVKYAAVEEVSIEVDGEDFEEILEEAVEEAAEELEEIAEEVAEAVEEASDLAQEAEALAEEIAEETEEDKQV